ncbi:MAG: phosphoribosylformimino-5-aminoimidazole carboxamide ribotide isomerase [Fibrobacter sp.]|nr:phosphoribosylformimino-5-aminoimidazole carboxamide ribotide isomerase [Fibrobacter sp.]
MMKFRPCIDIHSGKVKQIIGSTLNDKAQGLITNFESDLAPSWYAKLYKKDQLSGGHVIMLGAGNEEAAIDALKAYPGGLQIGGGINPDNAAEFIDSGASHVVVTSFVFKDGIVHWDNLKKISKVTGKKRLVLDLSCTKNNGLYVIVTDRWQKMTSVSLCSQLFEKMSGFCDEFLIHATDFEGKKEGIDEELVSLLADLSPIQATYAGGVRSIDDLEKIKMAGRGKIDVTIGSALDLFGGSLEYKKIVEWHRREQKLPD